MVDENKRSGDLTVPILDASGMLVTGRTAMPKASPRGKVLWKGGMVTCPTCLQFAEDCAAASGGIGHSCRSV